MKTIQELIDLISVTIANSCVYSRFCGIAENMTDKELPYGIALQGDCQGTICGYNDNEEAEGYMFIKSIYTKQFGLRVTEYVDIGIYLFVPTKICKQTVTGGFSHTTVLLRELRTVFGVNNVSLEPQNYKGKSLQEISLIILTAKLPQNCELQLCT